MNRKPVGNREFFLATVILIGISLLCPPIAWLTGLLAIFVIAAWLVHDTHGFLSAVWRIFLLFVLLGSSVLIVSILTGPETVQYRTQFLTGGSIGFALSTLGLVCSFVKARKDWTVLD
jgi:hypothetical protein